MKFDEVKRRLEERAHVKNFQAIMEVLKKIKDYVNFENQDSKATQEAKVDLDIKHFDQ